MFLIMVLFILNIQKIKATVKNYTGILTQETMNVDQLTKVQSQDEKLHNCKINNMDHEKKSLKILFDALLEKTTFPLKSQLSWPKEPNQEEYEINREDIQFDLFMNALYENCDEKARTGKQLAVYNLVYSFAKKTKLIHEELMRVDYNIIKIDLNMLKRIFKNYCHIVMNKVNNLQVEQIFKKTDYQLLIYYMRCCYFRKFNFSALFDENEEITPKWPHKRTLHFIYFTIPLIAYFLASVW
ncbi:uncharacterized protein VNE69_01080 [Vairimorpha necatrix]|uniref:Uncharacterized protein n=1 Tax=Vairimorpha necatrix TaxID=6039 RepID=A0AAX4J885_9MICR